VTKAKEAKEAKEAEEAKEAIWVWGRFKLAKIGVN